MHEKVSQTMLRKNSWAI